MTVDRPLRIEGIDPSRVYKAAEIREMKANGTRSESASPVIKRIHRRGVEADPLRGLYPATIDGKEVVVEYEPDNELRDTEQIPLTEDGGIKGSCGGRFCRMRWMLGMCRASVKVGYEVSFNRYFYRPVAMRLLDEIRGDILELERETEGLMSGILGSDGQ